MFRVDSICCDTGEGMECSLVQNRENKGVQEHCFPE